MTVEHVDFVELQDYITKIAPEAGRITSMAPLGGGTSNPTYLLNTEHLELVLRHPPIGHGITAAHDVSREHRAMSALQGSDVPVPRTYGYMDDTVILGAPFYVMGRVRGMILADKPPFEGIPAGYAATPAERRAISLALVDSLVKLHAVDYEAVGLGQFGRPAGYVERQVKLWTGQWEQWKTRDYPAMDEVLRRLARALPETPEFTIVHGDYRLGNTILDADDPGNMLAILDWEMATLGHPIADVGYLMAYWGQADDDEVRKRSMDLAWVSHGEGFLPRAEMLEAYAERTGRDVSLADYFEILGRVKLAIFGERGYARNLQAAQSGEGVADPNRMEGWKRCNDQVEVCLAIADASENPKLRGE